MSNVSDVITGARELLNDTVAPYRFPDERLIRVLNGAFREAYRLRPDLFIGADYEVEYTVTDIATPTPLAIDSMFLNTIIEYVVGFTEMSDDEFTLDGRAAVLLSAFRNHLIGGASMLGSPPR